MKFSSTRFLPLLASTLLLPAPGVDAQTASVSVVYRFPAGAATTGNATPLGTLIQGSDGNFYGTAEQGGSAGFGSVYRLTPAGAYTTLYSFLGDQGTYPESAVLQASDGNFYGTTSDGGTGGDGTVYQLTPAGVLTTLHSFNLTDGRGPEGSLIQGRDGNLYGTTFGGGVNNTGTVYRITLGGTLTTLHSFVTGEGTAPQAALVQGSDGNFYGTAAFDGTPENRSEGDGSIFSITPGGVLTVLHHLSDANDGSNPGASLVQGSDGNFYGTIQNGGANGSGTIFKLTPAGAFTVLYTFPADGSGTNNTGAHPAAALVDGGDGRFYGSTASGGPNGNGTEFAVTPAGVLTTVYAFSATDANGFNNEGAAPFAGLLKGGDGRFYSPLAFGGLDGGGTVIALTAGPAFFSGQTSLANGVYYLSFPGGSPFGYYSYLTDPNYIFHFDLGYEYVFDAADGQGGVYFYDFASSGFFYTSPSFPFPYLYDFSLNSVVYYYPDPNNAGHYNTNGVRYFYVFNTGQIISK